MVDPYDAAFDRVEREVLLAREAVGKRQGNCPDCQYFQRPTGVLAGERPMACTNPLVSRFHVDVVTGVMVQTPHKMREWYAEGTPHIPELCGEERALFKSKLSWWERWFG